MVDFLARIFEWMNVEPAVSLLMIITAVVLFGSAFNVDTQNKNSFWPWFRQVIEAATGAVLFLGLLWAFRSVLNDTVATFYSTHGSLSDISRESAWSIWGRPHSQIELTIKHSHPVEVREELPREDPTQPPVYRTVTQIQEIPQNSITGFVGDVKMNLSEREKGYALYSGYVLDTTFHYDVQNDSVFETDAEFSFPLSSGQTLFENFVVEMDGQDLSSDLRFSTDLVSWTRKMKPHQKSEIVIRYSSRGMDYFYYQIPVQREIRNFQLILTIDRLPVSLLNYPDRVITPTDIQPTSDGEGSILTWKLDRAITIAGMGVSLPQPEQPGAQVLRVLVVAPYALTLLGAMLALTMLIWGEKIQFVDLSLLSAAYSTLFLVMAGVSDYFFGFWGSLLAGTGLVLLLTYFLFRRLASRALRRLIYGLVVFFTVAYPLSGLLPSLEQQNAFNIMVQVGLILYLVILSIHRRDVKSA
ncbi:MAG TPA: hypothetical protein VLT51_06220 [Anaerolineales bacterium]|nr:hypothetical protein [Anaerolineales bacterium]